MALDTHLKQLQKQATEAAAELAKIERLKAEFPDLDTHTDRWKNVRYMAVSANPRVHEVEFRRSCGCCSDSPLVAMPYLEFEGLRIYSNPHYVFVGQHDYNGHVLADVGWRKQYEKAGISYHAIDKIKAHLEALAPRDEPYEDDDEPSTSNQEDLHV
jgi:hypothetical protein